LKEAVRQGGNGPSSGKNPKGLATALNSKNNGSQQKLNCSLRESPSLQHLTEAAKRKTLFSWKSYGRSKALIIALCLRC